MPHPLGLLHTNSLSSQLRSSCSRISGRFDPWGVVVLYMLELSCLRYQNTAGLPVNPDPID